MCMRVVHACTVCVCVDVYMQTVCTCGLFVCARTNTYTKWRPRRRCGSIKVASRKTGFHRGQSLSKDTGSELRKRKQFAILLKLMTKLFDLLY